MGQVKCENTAMRAGQLELRDAQMEDGKLSNGIIDEEIDSNSTEGR